MTVNGRSVTLYWLEKDTPGDVQPLLRNLAEEYPVREGRRRDKGLQLTFEPIEEPGALRVRRRTGTARIQYASPALAARALGCLWAGVCRTDRWYEEKTPLRTLGFMPDCSRNLVITVPHFKKWLRRCALLGYNQAMLYTEDTYDLPGEPCFGYMRGAYTETELREIDDYAAGLGIEMVGCIQTLGHLGHLLRWPPYARIADGKGGTLLTLEKETYVLIDKMLAHWAKVFRSRRIHLGMDEAVDIGKGRGSDRFGPTRPAAELFFDHLNKVAALSEKHGLQPMIWSDLVFWVDTPHRGFAEAYHDLHISARSARKIRDRLPKHLELVYWDYSGDAEQPDDPKPYVKRIEKHRAVGHEPIMASGCWAWGKFWHDAPNLTEPRVAACVKACRQTGVKDLLMTLWTGYGGLDFDSVWAGLAYSAEHAFSESPSKRLLEKRYRAIFGADYQASAAGALDIWWDDPRGIGAANIFWDDPLQGILLRSFPLRTLRRMERHYQRKADQLSRWRGETAAGDMDYVRHVAELLALKVGLSHRFQTAYKRKSRKELMAVLKELPAVRKSLDTVRTSFRAMWLRQFKPFGMEVVQMRMGGLAARFEELETRLRDYLDGAVDTIAEMEVPALPKK